jgi:RNA polymerase sigma-70 factor, ECF subfamily
MTPRTLERLYREHGHAVYRRARRMLRDDEDARDIVQDVFLSLYREPERFEQRSSIATYLYSATTHACLTRLRNGRTRARLIAIETAGRGQLVPARGENQALACELLAALDEDDAELAIYLYCDELTHDEIADLLGCSRRHVGDLANRLRRKVMERVA